MSRYEKEWARKRRRLLFEVLGNVCAHAAMGNCKGPLQVDCIKPCGDKHHKMDTSARQSFYHGQLKKHNLQLLCEYHNATKDKKTDEPDIPF